MYVVNVHPVYSVVICITWGNVCLYDLAVYHIPSALVRVLMGKPEGKRPLGRPRRKWEVNIKTNLQEVGCRGMDWIENVSVLENSMGKHLRDN